MRIALVSPYSWTYPGGVTRHIEALADVFGASGHELRILAPVDPDDRLGAALHRGARPERRPPDPRVVSLGRTVGIGANGAVSNLAVTPYAVATLRAQLRHGRFDVVHVHEPVAPIVGWDALCATDAPLVGTFHCYSPSRLPNGAASLLGARRRLNRLHVRIAVSEAAAWTARSFFGGRYRVIPNGVDLGTGEEAWGEGVGGEEARGEGLGRDGVGGDGVGGERARGLRIVFVGQAVQRKGLPVLLSAFEALREQLPVSLTVIGATRKEVAPLLLDESGVTVLGKVSDAEKRARLRAADVLCAPSLGGESFGMVLTEAFAAGTAVVASDIPGYAGVVSDGVDGVLVAPGDGTALAEALRELALAPERCRAMGRAAAGSARRYAWPRVAAEVLDAYADARAVPEARGVMRRGARRLGVLPSDGAPRVPARALPGLEPGRAGTRPSSALAAVRRAAFVAAAAAGVLLALLALARIGLDRIAESLLASSPSLVLAGLGLMCVSMGLRGVAWHAILRAALPRVGVRGSDALRASFIGVLMSATLPARLGEPSRALIVARRLGRPRESLPVVLGTLVSQTLLNIVALLVLGVVMFSSVSIFNGHHGALLLATVAPVVIALAVLAAPALLPRGPRGPWRSARRHRLAQRVRGTLTRVREGLSVFRQPRLAGIATLAQLAAWVLQWLSCYVLLAALGLDGRAGLGAAAAVLFAVNVTAVLPATPSNVGVFQAACVAVLTGAYHVSAADALGYGIVLQAVEIATAVAMGMPALVREGLSWRDVRLRTMHASSVQLATRPAARSPRSAAEAEVLS